MTAFLPRVSSRKAHHGKPFARAGLAAAVIRKLHFIWVFLAVFTLMPGPTALAVVPDDIDCSEPQAAGSFAEFTCMILNGGFNFVASGEPSAQLWGGPIKPGSLQLDENGVDLGTGIFTLGAGPQISIGDPQGAGLTYAISAGAGGIGWHASLGNFNASVTKKAHGSILNGQTGTYFQVNGLLTSDTFFKPDGFTAISLTGRGATLTGLGPYVYTSSDGTVTEFSGTFSHPIFSTQIISYDQAFKVHEGQVGRIQKQTRPNGEILDYEYGVESVIPQNIVGLWTEDLTRLKFVRSNFGYTVTVDYKFNGTPNQLSEWRDWTTPINTTIKNEAVDEAGFTGVWPALTYTGNGLFELETVTDAEGGVTQYTYTGPYREYVSSIRFPGSTADDITLTYEVDPGLSVPNGPKWRVATLSRHGQTWGYSYSDSGAAGNTTGMTRTVTVTAPNNAQTVAVTKHWLIDTRYNSVGGFLQSFGRYRGQLLSVTDPLGRTTSYQYDSYDRKTRVTLPEGNYTTFTYDARGNVTETRAVAKSGSGLADIVTTATYPSTCTNTLTCNKPTSVTDALGKVTDYTYDATHGGVLTETQPDPDGAGPLARPQTRFAYTAKQAKYQNGANNWITGGSIYMLTGTSTCATGTTCNGTGDETLATNAYRASTVANNIELLSTTIAAGDGSITATTAYAYDEIGNLSAVDGPLAGAADTTAFFYDNRRRSTGVVSPDPDGAGALKFRASRTTYNARGRPSVVEGGTVTAQTASAFAAFASLSKTASAYDIYGRKTEDRIYDGATTLAVRQYTYDVNSRLDCFARRMNPAVFATLPASACVLGTQGTEGPDRITKATYDLAGQVTKTTKALGTLIQQDDRVTTYSTNGLLATLADANGNKTTYEYDGFDRLSKLRFPSKTTAGTSSTTDYETYGYDANGNVTSERRRDGQLVAITYDDLSRRSFRDAP
ncbi:MAG: RHS repeat protein, partial [Alphaproteobacteria bacterium]|nr:RHS repeat protein [Alphaproteobacteria bacterium]